MYIFSQLISKQKKEKIAISLVAFEKTGKARIAPSLQQEVGKAVVFIVHAFRKLNSAN